MVHGLLHGRYEENGRQINENEFYEWDGKPGESNIVFSEEDFCHRLDLFFKM